MFAYDRSLPLDYTEISTSKENGYTMKDMSYLSPHGDQVPGYLVIPDTDDYPFPAVIFMHPGQGDRTTFLTEAKALASKGIVSLLISGPSIRNKSTQQLSKEQQLMQIVKEITSIHNYIQIVVDLRRGIDLLCNLDIVDPNRLIYVGHSLGATWGGVLAGVEERIKAFVLLAGFSRVSQWHKSSGHPIANLVRQVLSKEEFEHFIFALEPLDAIHYIKNTSNSSLFFQFAHNDEFVSREQAEAFFEAASSPKEIVWYETDHLFTNHAASYLDRVQWIFKQLELEKQ
ncbi:alpha/beta hydrolase family protein [Paenibacillus chartarius]|uniref:Alpha/beta hydrolase family protein n=1 Tax=Paenibacillus chartarius TaxID=747481 RepID=A0ABV6DVN6_9BACL